MAADKGNSEPLCSLWWLMDVRCYIIALLTQWVMLSKMNSKVQILKTNLNTYSTCQKNTHCGEWKLWRMSPSSPNVLSYLSSQAGWERHIRSGDFWKIKISNCRKVPKQPDYNSLFNRLIHFNRRQVRHGDQPWYPHVLWPLRWTIAHSTWMVPLFHQDYTCTMDKNWTVCYNGVHTHNGPDMGHTTDHRFVPSKSNLRSLPEKMNTWPEKNLMTMTSDVRDKTLDHVLYLLHPDTKETKDLGPDVEEWVLK